MGLGNGVNLGMSGGQRQVGPSAFEESGAEESQNECWVGYPVVLGGVLKGVFFWGGGETHDGAGRSGV